jgi:hypothetical protein
LVSHAKGGAQLKVFENRALRRIFIPKREEVAGGWRRQHNEELHNLYASPNIRMIESRRMMWMGRVARIGEMRNAYSILVGKSEGKISFGRHRCRWKGDIKMVLREIEWEGVTGCIWLRIGISGGLL